jgi:hypothetical protein
MIVYRGSSTKDFKIKKWVRSRYGLRCLFFASNIELAKLYAIHRANEMYLRDGGFVHEVEIQGYIKEYDFGHAISYSNDFRNLIYKLHREGHKIVRIINVFDYPSKKLMRPTGSDVIVVFDYECIKSFKLIMKGVRLA